jgi:transposase-like protein
MRNPKHWGQPCPHPACSHSRLMDRGNMSAISPSLTRSGTRRIFRCSACEPPFSATRDTVFFALRSPAENVMMALKTLLVTVALSDIGFVLGATEETVLEWLRRVAQQAHEMILSQITENRKVETRKPLIFQEAALARPKGAWPVVANHRLSAVFSFSRR